MKWINWIKEHKAISAVILIIVVAIIVMVSNKKNKEGSIESLARCIKNSGAKFYGSKTCQYCISQKQMFGADADDLPYIECTSESGSKMCQEKDIKGYPTWIFSDGTRQQGEVSLEVLAQKTKCTKKQII